jgi:hypothetical protein
MEYHLNYEEFLYIKSYEFDRLICLTKGELDLVLFRKDMV